MKKTSIILATALIVSMISCKNEPKPEEQPNVEQAIEQMTQALDTANAVAPVADTATTHK
jgi:PBP1b-binding outer membrane lipoprotein LpoB